MPDKPFDPFDLEARKIYAYHDGFREVRGDPAVLHRRLLGACTWEQLTAIHARAYPPAPEEGAPAPEPDPLDQSNAQDELVTIIRKVFAIKPADEGGLTEAEAIDVYGRFNAWQDQVKKNTGTSPPTSASSDGLPASI